MAKPTAHQLVKEIQKELERVRIELGLLGADVKVLRDLGYEIKSLHEKAKQLEEALDKIEKQLIPPSEYKIVKQLIFGAVGLALVALIGALISQVLK